MPEGPLASHGTLSSCQATPAMSRWIHGVSPTNSLRNIAAVMAPPQRPPVFLMSAMGGLDLLAVFVVERQSPELFAGLA